MQDQEHCNKHVQDLNSFLQSALRSMKTILFESVDTRLFTFVQCLLMYDNVIHAFCQWLQDTYTLTSFMRRTRVNKTDQLFFNHHLP